MSQTSQELKYSDFQWQKGNNSTFLKINCNDYEMLTRPEIDALLSKFNEKLGGPGMMAVVDGHKLRMQRNNDETLTIWDNGLVGQQSAATTTATTYPGASNSSGGGYKVGSGSTKERAFWVAKEYFFFDNFEGLRKALLANDTLWRSGERNTILPGGSVRIKVKPGDSEPVDGVIVAHEKNVYFKSGPQ